MGGEAYGFGGLGERSTRSISRMYLVGSAQYSRGLSPSMGNSLGVRGDCESKNGMDRAKTERVLRSKSEMVAVRSFMMPDTIQQTLVDK